VHQHATQDRATIPLGVRKRVETNKNQTEHSTAMPVMRASRPESKQKIGDVLYEQLKCEHGKLAGKLVGMLLEGLPHERLATLCHEPAALKELVSQAAPLLEIQRQELASQPDVTADGIELLVLLVLLASPSLSRL
jgi:hypothetical protein